MHKKPPGILFALTSLHQRYFTPDDLIVQFRAERRSGAADFGLNRRRLEEMQSRGGLGGPVLVKSCQMIKKIRMKLV